jgi:hypothetical protein
MYRWLAVYLDKDAGSFNLEVGQVVAGNGAVTVLWGDSAVEQASANTPLVAGSLESAARAAGLTPPTPPSVSDLILLASKAAGAPTPTPTADGGLSQPDGGSTQPPDISAQGPTGTPAQVPTADGMSPPTSGYV